jgi:hypothetical protein
MTFIEGEITIARPAETVFDFAADQRNEPRYNPRMVRAEKVTGGPVGNGTVFRSAVRAAGRLSDHDHHHVLHQRIRPGQRPDQAARRLGLAEPVRRPGPDPDLLVRPVPPALRGYRRRR